MANAGNFGEVCLGCLQRAGDVRRNEDEREDDGRSTEDAAAAAAA